MIHQPPDIPPRNALWVSTDGTYQLQELLHPSHLLSEIEALGHCLGTRTHPREDIARHAFALNVESGEAHIYSLADRHAPLCTLLVSLEPPTLTDCAGRWGTKLGQQSYFPALMAAIEHLDVMFGGLQFDDTMGLYAPDILIHWRRRHINSPARSS